MKNVLRPIALLLIAQPLLSRRERADDMLEEF